MGLLDEAIRDHLELKRRRGADPAEVAREQHEALDPPSDGARTSAFDQSENDRSPAGGEIEEIRDLPPGATDAGEMHAAGEAPTSAAELEGSTTAGEAAGMEETAELDMKAVFEHGTSGAAGEPAHVPEPIAGQEHLDFEPGASPGAQHKR
jgi:hypothetical protein